MNLSPLPIQKFFDNNGRPLVGGLVFTYAAGTTTPIATYSDESGTLNSNPIELDYRGECSIWLDPELTYKFVLSPAGDTDPPTRQIWTVDDIRAGMTAEEITREFIGRKFYPESQPEIDAGLTIVNYYEYYGQFERYGDYVDATTDFSSAVQAAFDVAYAHVAKGFGNRTYRCNSTLSFPAEQGHQLDGNNCTIDSYAAAAAISFDLLPGDLYTQGGYIRDIGVIVNGGSSRSAIIARTSYMRWEGVSVALRSDAVSAKGIILPGDEDNGSGPYYNTFIGCNVNMLRTDQRGVFCATQAPVFRAINANYWFGGRVAGVGIAFTVTGAGNNFYGPTIEGQASVAFDFVTTAAGNCTNNNVFGAYLEGDGTMIGFRFDSGTRGNGVYGPLLTGVATTFDDANLGTTGNFFIAGSLDWILPKGVKFSSTSADVNALDYYGEVLFTPGATFATPGDLSVTYGGSNGGTGTRIGDRFYYEIDLDISDMDFTTASGDFRITGLPFPAGAGPLGAGAIGFQSANIIWSGGRTMLSVQSVAAQSYVVLQQSGSAVPSTAVGVGNFITNNPLRLQIAGSYRV